MRLNQRDLRFILLRPQWRVMLLLFMAIRAFSGHRKLRRLILIECVLYVLAARIISNS